MNNKSFYDFIFHWVKNILDQRPKEARPLIVGLSAPQGAGKTTLTKQICEMFAEEKLKAISVSIDDFYLTRKEQIDLAAKYPENTFLQQRGYPGTHDIELGIQTLNELKQIEKRCSVQLPSYDKSAHQGQGDRKPLCQWPVVQVPVDLVFLEGWMLGFKPVQTKLTDPSLEQINQFLVDYQKWIELLDVFIWLEPRDFKFVLEWRVEAEEKMKSQGKSGMSTEEIKTYIAKFIPAYELYLPGLRKEIPVKGSFLHLMIEENRIPKNVKIQILRQT